MSRRIIVGLLLLVAACGGVEVADTNCDAPELAADRVKFASIVLLGTATVWDGTTATFEIDEIWRGPDLPREVEIVPEPGRAFAEGVRYLVFPTNSPSPLADTRCSATTRWTEELEPLRPETARTPSASPAKDADLPWEWLLAAAVVLAVGIGTRSLLERRRHPEPEWDPEFTFDSEP